MQKFAAGGARGTSSLVSEDVPLARGLEGGRPLKAIATRGEDGAWRQREQILPIRIPHVAPTDNCTE